MPETLSLIDRVQRLETFLAWRHPTTWPSFAGARPVGASSPENDVNTATPGFQPQDAFADPTTYQRGLTPGSADAVEQAMSESIGDYVHVFETRAADEDSDSYKDQNSTW